MTFEEKKKIYAALAAPFPEHAIQRTEGRVTGRGYDTSGIGYQWVANRLNEVIPFGWRAHRTVTVKEITRANGRPAFEAICDITLELGEWVDGNFIVFAESLADGGHLASSEADARKGAYTNAFKKAAAFHGVGRQAYEGTLDDDNVPAESGTDLPAEPARPATPSRLTVAQGTVRMSTLPSAPVRTPAPARNRLSSKQLAAIWALGRKLGYEQQGLRQFVKGKFGSQPAVRSREQASQLIGAMSDQAGNGHAEEHSEPGAEG
jgi:hypothetical protein